MKKRTMKKWIPKETSYCGSCKWRKYIGIKEHYKGSCYFRETCKVKDKCGIEPQYMCQNTVWKCKYLNYTDYNQTSLLWDGCKECGIKDISKEEKSFSKYW